MQRNLINYYEPREVDIFSITRVFPFYPILRISTKLKNAEPLVHMSNAGPVVVSMNAGARYLVKFLQLAAANLADNSIFNLYLGVVAKHNYHPSSDPLKRLKRFAF
jgi:hypothetical protein